VGIGADHSLYTFPLPAPINPERHPEGRNLRLKNKPDRFGYPCLKPVRFVQELHEIKNRGKRPVLLQSI